MNQTAAQVLPDGLEPAWDIARLFPPQGGWSEEEYLALPGNRLTEAESVTLPGFTIAVDDLFGPAA